MEYDSKFAKQFDEAYWAAQHPDVRALRAMPQGYDRQQAAVELYPKGHKIDLSIHGWGMSPYTEMFYRTQGGYTWVVSFGMNARDYYEGSPLAPLPGLPAYNPKLFPPGCIKVSLDLADYPPFEKKEPEPVPEYNPVGGPIDYLPGAYYSSKQDREPLGAKWTDPRGTFVKQGTQTPFGVFGQRWVLQ